jgi:hypothetical protein
MVASGCALHGFLQLNLNRTGVDRFQRGDEQLGAIQHVLILSENIVRQNAQTALQRR